MIKVQILRVTKQATHNNSYGHTSSWRQARLCPVITSLTRSRNILQDMTPVANQQRYCKISRTILSLPRSI